MHSKGILTGNELLLLKILWGAEEPLSRTQILDYPTARGLNPASFHQAINSLMEMGYVKISGFERCGKIYGRTYAAAKTQEDFILDVANTTRPEGQKGVSPLRLVMAFTKREQISEETIAELEEMLAERRRELEQEKQRGNVQ